MYFYFKTTSEKTRIWQNKSKAEYLLCLKAKNTCVYRPHLARCKYSRFPDRSGSDSKAFRTSEIATPLKNFRPTHPVIFPIPDPFRFPFPFPRIFATRLLWALSDFDHNHRNPPPPQSDEGRFERRFLSLMGSAVLISPIDFPIIFVYLDLGISIFWALFRIPICRMARLSADLFRGNGTLSRIPSGVF